MKKNVTLRFSFHRCAYYHITDNETALISLKFPLTLNSLFHGQTFTI